MVDMHCFFVAGRAARATFFPATSRRRSWGALKSRNGAGDHLPPRSGKIRRLTTTSEGFPQSPPGGNGDRKALFFCPTTLERRRSSPPFTLGSYFIRRTEETSFPSPSVSQARLLPQALVLIRPFFVSQKEKC